MQLIFAIGASDITDLIGNTFGGIIGIAIYLIIRRLFKTNKILNSIALIGTICMVVLLSLLVMRN